MKTEKNKQMTSTGDKGWKEIPIGGLIVDAGNSDNYETGSWRSFRPIRDAEKCTNCLLCWIYCPDSAIEVNDGKVIKIKLKHCKGCGICAEECPVKAIAMEEESKFTKGYTIPLIQLNSLKTILVFSHKHNSLNKEKLLENPESSKITVSPYNVDDFVKDPVLKQFYMYDMNIT